MDTVQIVSTWGIFAAPVVYFLWNLRKPRPENKEKSNFSLCTTEKTESYGLDKPEIIIIGSGVVGSTLAFALAKDGRFVTVIERDLSEPDRIVGELLQPGGVNALRSLGLGCCLDDIDAQTVHGYVVHDLESDSHVQIPYPQTANGHAATGRSFHHGKFVQNLRKFASQQPTVRYIEGTVSQLMENADASIRGVTFKQQGSGKVHELLAPLTVVCDGHFSRFRKVMVKEPVKVSSHFVGMILDNCPQHTLRHAELVLGSPSPVLVYRISEVHTRVLVDIQGSLPKNMTEYMREQVALQLPEHIRPHFLESIENGSRIRSMPSSFLAPRPVYRLGAIVIGDAYNMRHPLTGGGMSVGLHDVLLWQKLLKAIPDCRNQRAVCTAQIVFHRRRKRSHAFVVNVLAQALYALFSASDDYLRSLRRACFGYFQLGGECVSGPVGLLSVLHPNPLKLIGHFFAVAFYAVYCNFRDIQSVDDIPKALFHPVGVILKACAVICPLIWSEIKTILFY